MKDLKHMIFFEDLLQQSHNALVQQATDEGQLALGYNCYYIPEVLLNLKGCFSTRLRAPNSGTAEIASYYMTNRNCPYVRCILERAIEGGFNYLNALFGAEGCAAMERMEEHFALLHPVQNDRFFTTIIDPPMKGDKTSLDYYKAQLQLKVLDALHEHYGVDVSDEALREAVARHNHLCRVVTAIGDFRKLENPPITGYEYHVMMLVSQVCPHDLILETCGAMVVADRYCFGGFPGREEIVIREGETAFDAICRHYLHWNQCVRFMDGGKIDQRHQELRRLVREYRADGVIYESMKFCEFWSYEKVLASHVLQQEMGIPCCTIEKEYNLGSVGQLRTRFQAFVESLEIKKIGAEKEGKL